MNIPERCQFITWNIRCDSNLYTNQRYKEILQTLKSSLPDMICLQEVTENFLEILFNEIWLKEKNYYVIIMGKIFNKNEKQSYGQLMLMKNFRPRTFDICSLDLKDNQNNEYIIARFGLNTKVTIDLVNIHLYNSNEKRSEVLEYLLKRMNTQNYMIIGDFNFGDYDIREENILQKSKYQIHDLWKDIYDIDEVIFLAPMIIENDVLLFFSESWLYIRSNS
jgi:endonuclease/exonuclease/phosphatase family metal-dependent hydrolase